MNKEYSNVVVTPYRDPFERLLRVEFAWEGESPYLYLNVDWVWNTFGWSRYIDFSDDEFQIGPFRFDITVDPRDESLDPLNQFFEVKLKSIDRLFGIKEAIRTGWRRLILVLEALGFAWVPPGQIPSLGHVRAIARRKKVGVYREWEDTTALEELFLLHENGTISTDEYFNRLEKMQISTARS